MIFSNDGYVNRFFCIRFYSNVPLKKNTKETATGLYAAWFAQPTIAFPQSESMIFKRRIPRPYIRPIWHLIKIEAFVKPSWPDNLNKICPIFLVRKLYVHFIETEYYTRNTCTYIYIYKNYRELSLHIRGKLY